MELISENITVAIRVRPILSYESFLHVAWDPISYSRLKCLKNDKIFEFEKIYPPTSTTQRIFDEVAEARI